MFLAPLNIGRELRVCVFPSGLSERYREYKTTDEASVEETYVG